jgi:hypothetical protein
MLATTHAETIHRVTAIDWQLDLLRTDDADATRCEVGHRDHRRAAWRVRPGDGSSPMTRPERVGPRLVVANRGVETTTE